MTHKIYLAPIRGCTDAVFRTSYAGHFSGIDSAVAPFFDTKGSDIKPAHLRRLLPENNTGLAVVPQSMTNSPEDFAFFAHRSAARP
jgi:tRNA-dihydrouridine synthase